jgi:hypothetical protein
MATEHTDIDVLPTKNPPFDSRFISTVISLRSSYDWHEL